MKKWIIAVVLIIIVAVIGTCVWAVNENNSGPKPVWAGLQSGVWVNTNSSSRALTRVDIINTGIGWRIHIWGKCYPEDCDWGTVPLQVFGDSVSDGSAKYGLAYWDSDFKDTIVSVHIDGQTLVTETYNIFKYDPRRSNYFIINRFRMAAC